MRVLWSLLLLAACGPSLPDDADTGTGDITTGDPTTGAPDVPTTTGEVPPDPTAVTTATTLPPPDETTGDPTTGAPEQPLQVLSLMMLGPESSALNEVQHWQPPPDGACDGEPFVCTQPPELGSGRLLIDGVLAPVGTTTAPLGARVAVLFPYKSCALGCGRYDFITTSPNGDGTGNGLILPGLPCETGEQNVWLGLDLGPLEKAGGHLNSLRVTDACGLESNEKSVGFTPL